MSTLYENIGGEQALKTIVQEFYSKVLDDPRLTGYFSGIDVPRLRRSQLAIFASALGARGVRPRMRASQQHAGRGIDHAEFDLVICHLADSLRQAGVADVMMTDVLLTIAPLARDIVPVTGQDNDHPHWTSRVPGGRSWEHVA